RRRRPVPRLRGHREGREPARAGDSGVLQRAGQGAPVARAVRDAGPGRVAIRAWAEAGAAAARAAAPAPEKNASQSDVPTQAGENRDDRFPAFTRAPVE